MAELISPQPARSNVHISVTVSDVHTVISFSHICFQATVELSWHLQIDQLQKQETSTPLPHGTLHSVRWNMYVLELGLKIYPE